MFSKKWFALASLIVVVGMLFTACAPQEVVKTVEVTVPPEKVEVTKEVEVVATPTQAAEEEEEEAAGECCDVYSMGMYEEPVSLNYWNYLGPGSSVWTQYAVSGHAASLYTLSDQRFDFVPYLAKDVVEPVQEGDVWTFTVEMLEGAQWSDGEPITADDVVFTHNACKDLELTQNWPNQCAPLGIQIDAEALDEYTVQYTFYEEPSLGTWQAGVALAPIMPEHFWGATVTEARSFIEGVEEPELERPEDCEADDLSDEEQEACAAWATYDEAFENARKTLYEADAMGQPSAGGMVTEQWEVGAFVQRAQNENFFFEGAEIVEYDDGTWMQNLADGTTRQLYGDAAGEETLRFTGGPYAPNVIMSLYGSQDSAFLALQEGEIDFVFSPTGIPRGLRDAAEQASGINTYVNADYGMYYIAFNMRKYPMSEPEFREAFDIIIDKEFVVNSVLQGTVYPMYSTMPPGNGFYYNPDVEFPYKDLSREERVNAAVEVLTEAGWSWTEEPYWDADLEDVVPGEDLTMPNGEPCPELTILGPGPAYDPLRATFNQWISEWGRELGIPVGSELTGFNTILGPVFVEANFDMYILGWSLGNPAFPDYYESFFHSRNDTATSGNFNTPGMQDEEFDALVDEFMSTTDVEKARELVFELQEMLAEKRPYICLFYKQVHDAARDNLVFPYTEVLSGITDAAGFQTDTQPLFE